MAHTRAFAAGIALVAAAAGLAWWLGLHAPAGGSAGGLPAGPSSATSRAAGVQGGTAGPGRPMEDSFFAARRGASPGQATDPLLVHGLRDTLEALLMEAQDGDVTDPAMLKARLAALAGKHFPADLVPRALALAGRYVDYRVALGQLRTPKDATTDPVALREALEARHKVRQQFFDGDEYDALFAREADLDRYTLARLEIARNTALTPEQRAKALRDAENELPEERRAERSAATAHMDAAAQTAAFNARNTDDPTRHAARAAQYGETAAQAMAQLDREERHWQQRLDQYSQARSTQGDGAALEQLRRQLFSSEEQQRVDAALALRRMQAGS